ncbi:MAG TPA: outer membrane protein transport protein, partial [Kofleriaceae bacterium]
MKRIAVMLAVGGTAHAGGMFLPVRGVHGVERAGAVVAGADGADALFDNPAGLAHLGGGQWELLVDGTFVKQSVDYTRTDSGGNALAPVSNSYPGIVAPSVALAYGLNDRLVVGAGFYAPYAGLGRYPVDGPERYASASLAESLFVTLTVGA